VIALKFITEQECVELEDEGLCVRISFTLPNANNKQILEIAVPDDVFINALADAIENYHTEDDGIGIVTSSDWFDEFKVEMNLVPKYVTISNGNEDGNVSCHEDVERSESPQVIRDEKD